MASPVDLSPREAAAAVVLFRYFSYYLIPLESISKSRKGFIEVVTVPLAASTDRHSVYIFRNAFHSFRVSRLLNVRAAVELDVGDGFHAAEWDSQHWPNLWLITCRLPSSLDKEYKYLSIPCRVKLTVPLTKWVMDGRFFPRFLGK